MSAETSVVDLTDPMRVPRLWFSPSSAPLGLGIWAREGSGYGCKEKSASSAHARRGPQVPNRPLALFTQVWTKWNLCNPLNQALICTPASQRAWQQVPLVLALALAGLWASWLSLST